jgi:hypothetical protein
LSQRAQYFVHLHAEAHNHRNPVWQDPALLLHHVVRRIELDQQAAKAFKERRSFARHLDRPPVALKEFYTIVRLQRPHLFPDRRGRQVQRLGGGGKTALAADLAVTAKLRKPQIFVARCPQSGHREALTVFAVFERELDEVK